MSLSEYFLEKVDEERRNNLNEEIDLVWKKILDINETSDFEISVDESGNFKIFFDGKFGGYFNIRVKSLCSKIYKKLSYKFNIQNQSDLKLTHLKQFIRMLLDCNDEIKLFFCTDPIKQQIHQKIQIDLFRTRLNQQIWNVKKLKEGELNIDGERLVSLASHSRRQNRDARSIDLRIESNDKKFYGFLKYSQDRGTGQTEHQGSEVERWLRSSINYVNTNNNNEFFFVCSDGQEGERNIQRYSAIVNRFEDKILVGNTEQIIEKIINHE